MSIPYIARAGNEPRGVVSFSMVVEKSPDFNWKNISSEFYRVYYFKDSERIIFHPVAIEVSKSGGHRIVDSNGVSYYIPLSWVMIQWEADPYFVI